MRRLRCRGAFPGEPTEDTPYSRRVLRMLISRDAIVPEIWPFEIANNIFVAHSRRKGIDERQIAEYLELLKSLPIRVTPQQMWSNVDLESSARRWNLSAYDASYLELAIRRAAPLASTDDRLRQAAVDAGVELIA